MAISLFLDLDYPRAPNVNLFHTSRLLAGASLSRISNPIFRSIVLDVTAAIRYYPYAMPKDPNTRTETARGPVDTPDTIAERITRQFPDANVIVTGVQDVEAQESVAKSFPRLAQEKKLVFSNSAMPI